MPLVKQELLTHQEHPSSSPSFVRLVLIFYVVFCRSLFVLYHYSFGHCIVCSPISGFW